MKNDNSIMKDCAKLEAFLDEASTYDPGLSKGFRFKNLSHSIKRKKLPKTKTGKEPKYAYECQVDITDLPHDQEFLNNYLDLIDIATPEQRIKLERQLEEDSKRNIDSIIIHLSYKKSGEIGKAKIYKWQEKTCHIVFLSEKKGALSISKVSTKRLNDKKEKVLYKRS